MFIYTTHHKDINIDYFRLWVYKKKNIFSVLIGMFVKF